MREILSWLLTAMFSLPALRAQTIRHAVATDYIAQTVYSVTQLDAFSFISNQASLAKIKKTTGGIYGERRFMLAELSLYHSVVVIPTQAGNFGLKAGYHGFGAYHETEAGLAYGRSLGDKIDIGVQFNYDAINVAGYGSASATGFEAGVIFHLTDKLNAGIHLRNPVGGKFGGNAKEKLPFVYTAGLGYEASDNFFVCTGMEKEEDEPVNITAGIQYKIVPPLRARAGISTATSSWWLGIGVMIHSIRIDATASFHPQLGITPGILLLFNVAPASTGENPANTGS